MSCHFKCLIRSKLFIFKKQYINKRNGMLEVCYKSLALALIPCTLRMCVRNPCHVLFSSLHILHIYILVVCLASIWLRRLLEFLNPRLQREQENCFKPILSVEVNIILFTSSHNTKQPNRSGLLNPTAITNTTIELSFIFYFSFYLS